MRFFQNRNGLAKIIVIQVFIKEIKVQKLEF